MIFKETRLKGAFLVEPEKQGDERGFFARSWDQEVFQSRGLNPRVVQCNVSFNRKKGTLRGMHYQAKPHEEAKLVRCTRGAAYDVAIDLRPDSPTFKRWAGIEMTSDNHLMFYIPEGFAHGFVTLEDHTELFYQMSHAHVPASARGVRYDDPAFGIRWPVAIDVISERDETYPDFEA